MSKNKFDLWLDRIQKIAVILGVFLVVAGYVQVKQAINSINKNSFDVLWQLDTRIREGVNKEIFSAIENNKPILGSKIKDRDLDLYLGDLISINDAYARKLISIDSIDEWFSDYLFKTTQNKEVREYILEARKINPGYFFGLDEIVKKLRDFESDEAF